MIKKLILKDFIVFVVMLCIVGVIIYFLPSEVPIHINVYGKADMIVSKYFLFLGSIIPYSVYISFSHWKKR